MKKNFKKLLSLCLSLSVVLSSFMFVAVPEKALAADDETTSYSTNYNFKDTSLQLADIKYSNVTNRKSSTDTATTSGNAPTVTKTDAGFVLEGQLLKKSETEGVNAELVATDADSMSVDLDLDGTLAKGTLNDLVHINFSVIKGSNDSLYLQKLNKGSSLTSVLRLYPWADGGYFPAQIPIAESGKYLGQIHQDVASNTETANRTKFEIDIYTDRRENGVTRIFVNGEEFDYYYNRTTNTLDRNTYAGVHIPKYAEDDWTTLRFKVVPAVASYNSTKNTAGYDGAKNKLEIGKLSVVSVIEEVEKKIEVLNSLTSFEAMENAIEAIKSDISTLTDYGFTTADISNYDTYLSILADVEAAKTNTADYTVKYNFKDTSLSLADVNYSASVRKAGNQDAGTDPDVVLTSNGLEMSYQLLTASAEDATKAVLKDENEAQLFLYFTLPAKVPTGTVDDVIHISYTIKKNPEDQVQLFPTNSSGSGVAMLQHNQNAASGAWSIIPYYKVSGTRYATYTPAVKPTEDDSFKVDIYVDRNENGLSKLYIDGNKFTNYYDDPARDDDGTVNGAVHCDKYILEYNSFSFRVTPTLAYYDSNTYTDHKTKLVVEDFSVTSAFDDIENEIKEMVFITDAKEKAETALSIEAKINELVAQGYSKNRIENYSLLIPALNEAKAYDKETKDYTIDYNFKDPNLQLADINYKNVGKTDGASDNSVTADESLITVSKTDAGFTLEAQLLNKTEEGKAELVATSAGAMSVDFDLSKAMAKGADDIVHINYTITRDPHDIVYLQMIGGGTIRDFLYTYPLNGSGYMFARIPYYQKNSSNANVETGRMHVDVVKRATSRTEFEVDMYVDRRENGVTRIFVNGKEFDRYYDPVTGTEAVGTLEGVYVPQFDIDWSTLRFKVVPSTDSYNNANNTDGYDGAKNKLEIGKLSVTSVFDELEEKIEALTEIPNTADRKTEAISLYNEIKGYVQDGFTTDKIDNYAYLMSVLEDVSVVNALTATFGTEITGSVKVSNNKNLQKPLTLIAAAYADNGEFIGADIITTTALGNYEEKTLEYSIADTAQKGAVVKVIALEGFGTLKPYLFNAAMCEKTAE